MRNITLKLKDTEFTEHLSDMQLALFTDKQLDEDEREEVFKHLSQCKRCREVLYVATQIRVEEKKSKKIEPANNINYRSTINRLGAIASIVMLFILPSQIENMLEETPSFKSVHVEKGVIEESIEYWEELFDKWIGGDKG